MANRAATQAAINAYFGRMEFRLSGLDETSRSEVTQINADLDRVARKTLTDKYPSLSARDALANWNVVVGILARLAGCPDHHQ